MTKNEQDRLKELLMKEAEESEGWDFVTKEFVKLNEDYLYDKISEAELLVFDLSRKNLCKLFVAWRAYEDFMDLITPPFYRDDETYSLIKLARDICPPHQYHGHKILFSLISDDTQNFVWFAKTFLDIPERECFGFWWRNSFAMSGLVTYEDEEAT